MDNKKKIILSILAVLLLLAIGVTYAFFTYESGTKSDIVTGQIYMNYEETSTISLTGVFPETKEQALARQDENGVFEFTITGRNTSRYPVYYEIDLLEGGVMTGKTEQSTKILPDDVRIYLERDGEVLVDGVTYADWNNRRIYVDTVPAGTTSNIEHKYTLRMWIDENVTISDTDPDADYTTSEWNDAYTSLKVRVVGDFEEKEVTTDASCFAYNVIDTGITYDYPIITLDTSDEKVEACMANMMDDLGLDLSTTQDGYQSFCEGTGTIGTPFGNMSLKEFANFGIQSGETNELMMSMLPVITDITSETRYYELNTSEENINSCKEVMLSFAGSDRSDAKDGYQSFCEGTGTSNNLTIFDIYTTKDSTRPENNLAPYGLIERNVFTQVETPQSEIEITNYDETCGTNVVIPSTIEGLPVTRIADGNDSSGYSGVFSSKNITAVKFPDTLEYIGSFSFYENALTEVIIPDSVEEIGRDAFSLNEITNVDIGNGIKIINYAAFNYNPLVNVKIKSNPIINGAFQTSVISYPNNTLNFQTFEYGGTCAELNAYENVFNIWSGDRMEPNEIITTDNNSCVYDNYQFDI